MEIREMAKKAKPALHTAATILKTGAAHALGPIGALATSGNEGARLILDRYTPSQQTVQHTVNSASTQLREMSQKMKAGDPVNRVDRLVQQRGTGGYLSKAELQNLAPNLFADVSHARPLASLPVDSPSAWRIAPVDTLAYSNNPERVTGPNLKLSQGQIPAGRTRVMAHHLNSTTEPPQTLDVRTRFANNGTENVELLIRRNGVGIRKETAAVEAGVDALRGHNGKTLVTRVPLKPGQAHEMLLGTVEPGEVISSLAEVQCKGALDVMTASLPKGGKIREANFRTPLPAPARTCEGKNFAAMAYILIQTGENSP